jgi:hypothetical protein
MDWVSSKRGAIDPAAHRPIDTSCAVRFKETNMVPTAAERVVNPSS